MEVGLDMFFRFLYNRFHVVFFRIIYRSINLLKEYVIFEWMVLVFTFNKLAVFGTAELLVCGTEGRSGDGADRWPCQRAPNSTSSNTTFACHYTICESVGLPAIHGRMGLNYCACVALLRTAYSQSLTNASIDQYFETLISLERVYCCFFIRVKWHFNIWYTFYCVTINLGDGLRSAKSILMSFRIPFLYTHERV